MNRVTTTTQWISIFANIYSYLYIIFTARFGSFLGRVRPITELKQPTTSPTAALRRIRPVFGRFRDRTCS